MHFHDGSLINTYNNNICQFFTSSENKSFNNKMMFSVIAIATFSVSVAMTNSQKVQTIEVVEENSRINETRIIYKIFEYVEIPCRHEIQIEEDCVQPFREPLRCGCLFIGSLLMCVFNIFYIVFVEEEATSEEYSDVKEGILYSKKEEEECE